MESSVLIAVNICTLHLTQGDLVADVRQACGAVGASPDRLCVGLAESRMLHGGEATLRTLDEVRATGVGVAIDNFGIGCSFPWPKGSSGPSRPTRSPPRVTPSLHGHRRAAASTPDPVLASSSATVALH